MDRRHARMVEGVGFKFLFISKLSLCRQVPGLQPKRSTHDKRGVSNLKNRTRPDLVERILAQRARRAEITANNHRSLPPNPVQQQPSAVQQTSNAEASGSHSHHQDQPPNPRNMSEVAEEEDQARRREAELKELARQQGETAHSGSPSLPPALPNLTNLPPVPNSQPPPAAKRQVSLANSCLDFTYNAASGSHGLEQ